MQHAGADALADAHRLFQRGVGQEDDELLAARAHDDVLAMVERTAHGAGETLQRVVAARMAVAVVVGLEVVDIERERRQHAALPVRVAPQLVATSRKPR